uniref:DM2 domain-containing protein n=1 Tax=Lates calcarifer TaxID=8187 RepID=A0A4W6CUF4_LATCA
AITDNCTVRPKVEFHSLLQHAGATKDVFTMKEVQHVCDFYLGQYIIQKQLYDQKQQHIVHCSQDALGRVLGVDSFSVKEPRVLFAMITKNLVAVKSQVAERGTEVRHRMSSYTPFLESDEEEEEEGKKRRRSDSYSLTFDDSLSWCVIGGLGSGRETQQPIVGLTQHSESEVTVPASDSDSDNFSVEFEVESIDSDDYNEDDASVSADDQVYEVTIFEAEDDDSFDEDTEITEADYWRCVRCDELNPPLPGTVFAAGLCARTGCLRCQTTYLTPTPPVLNLCHKANHPISSQRSSDVEENEGVDVPDGKRDLSSSQPSSSYSSSTPKSFSHFPDRSPPPPIPPPPLNARGPRLGAQRVSGVAAAGFVPGPCLICQSVHRPRTDRASNVCYVCARKLKKRNKLCPVCRLPIQSVVLTYLS